VIANARAIAVIPVSNLEQALEFYEGALGLPVQQRIETLPQNREARFKVGQTEFAVYESVGAGESRATLMAFEVDDVEATVEDMRSRGVTFEEYDLPDLKTENGIATTADEKAAWFKDPDGNIIAVSQPVRKPAAVS
jgi:catechol 2,3-dioxygenase-like lactoylglutathione lyase family enzyme